MVAKESCQDQRTRTDRLRFPVRSVSAHYGSDSAYDVRRCDQGHVGMGGGYACGVEHDWVLEPGGSLAEGELCGIELSPALVASLDVASSPHRRPDESAHLEYDTDDPPYTIETLSA